MKILVASDLHGSASCCARLLEAFQNEGAERMLLLGDILYHGPRNELPEGYAPKEVIAMLNPLSDRILCVRGNCEAEVDEMVLRFPIAAEAALFWKNRLVFASHGHVFHADRLPPLQRGDLLLVGHTHVPAWQETPEGVLVCNPGSVSLPKENSPKSYLMLTEEELVWKTLDGTAYHRMAL